MKSILSRFFFSCTVSDVCKTVKTLKKSITPKGAASWFANLEKFSLKFSSSLFVLNPS